MNKLIFFASGLAIGAFVGWYFTKDRYEKMAQEEIESVKETFSKREKNRKEKEMEKKTYEKIINDRGYSGNRSSNDISHEEIAEDEETVKKPYTIPPEEFGEIDGYSLISYTYYANGILADDINDPVGDILNTVGEDFADGFGEYAADAVYIRNEAKHCDYEILRVLDTWSE